MSPPPLADSRTELHYACQLSAMRAFHRISGRRAIAHGSPDRLSLLRQIRRARGIDRGRRTGDRKDLLALDFAAAAIATGAVEATR
jgi:hypothetical protein